jgi:hypothetical protein
VPDPLPELREAERASSKADYLRGDAAVRVRLGTMDLEEKSLDQIGDRCEECGAKLTRAEIQAAMESGGPALCTVHAEEFVPVGEEDDLFDEG